MSGLLVAALMLSAALVVWPASPRRRLTWAAPARRRSPTSVRRVGHLIGCAGVALLPMTGLMTVPTVLAVAVLGVTVSLRYRRRGHSRCALDEELALQTALDVLVGELRVGAHPVRAFSIAAEETGGPVGAGMRAVAVRATLGADVATGLRAAARSSTLPAHWERLAVCWQLANEHGLAIAALMRAAQRDIAERQRFSARVRSGMAGARATAAILAGLPVLGVVLGQLIGARPLSFLLNGHAGGWLLVVGLTLACGGLLWCDRITDRCIW